MLTTLFVVTCFLSGSVEAGSCVQSPDGSGKFGLCPTCNCEESMIQIYVDFVRELDSNGQKVTQHFKEQMASSNFVVAPQARVRLGSPAVDAVMTSFWANISVGSGPNNCATQSSTGCAKLIVKTYYFSDATAVQNGDSTVSIAADAMKFDIALQNWPFAQPENTLSVGLKLLTSTYQSSMPLVLNPIANGNRLDLSNFYFETPLSAVYDGASGPVTMSVMPSSSTTPIGPNSIAVTDAVALIYSFKSFSNTMLFDPTFGYSSPSSSDNGAPSAQSVGVLVAVVMTSLVALVAALALLRMYLRSRRERQEIASVKLFGGNVNKTSDGTPPRNSAGTIHAQLH